MLAVALYRVGWQTREGLAAGLDQNSGCERHSYPVTNPSPGVCLFPFDRIFCLVRSQETLEKLTKNESGVPLSSSALPATSLQLDQTLTENGS